MTFVATTSAMAHVGEFALVTPLISHVKLVSGGFPKWKSRLFSPSMCVHSVNATVYTAPWVVASKAVIAHVARRTLSIFMNALAQDAPVLSFAPALSVATCPLNCTLIVPVSAEPVAPTVIWIVRYPWPVVRGSSCLGHISKRRQLNDPVRKRLQRDSSHCRAERYSLSEQSGPVYPKSQKHDDMLSFSQFE